MRVATQLVRMEVVKMDEYEKSLLSYPQICLHNGII